MEDIQSYYFFNSIGAVLCIFVMFSQMVAGQIPPTLEVRLVDGTSNKGILEVQFNGTWGRVCDDGFDNNAAVVACRMLGFSSNRTVYFSANLISTANTTSPIILDDLSCVGNESTLALCRHSMFFQHNCGHSEDVALLCDISYDNVQFRLRNQSLTAGLLEMLVQGIWGTICGYSFDNRAAQVACKTLGFPYQGAIAFFHSEISAGYNPYWPVTFVCSGGEVSLMDCNMNSTALSNCGHSNDVGIVCADTHTLSENVEVRLVGGGGPWAGRVEIKYAGLWGTICDDSFNRIDAGVVCRMLGYGTDTHVRTVVPGTSSPIWLDEVSCNGMETNIANCRHSVFGQNDCSHSEDVAVVCHDGAPSMNVRLVGGPDRMNGRVEVNINGVWGTVCDDLFSDIDAKVICRQLGLPIDGATAVGNAYFGTGSGPILLDDVDCLGDESTISHCFYSRTPNCQHSEDVGVRCVAAANTITQVRLVGGINEWEGKLEIMHNGVWGTVCDDSFDDFAAKVVCRMLHLSTDGATVVGASQFSTTGSSSLMIWLDDVNCLGTESSISYCSHRAWGENDCSHSEDVAIRCAADNTIAQVRLVGGIGGWEGTLEIMHSGEWGTVCDDSFNNLSAKVVCRMLNLPTDGAVVADASRFSTTISSSLRIWLDDVNCAGTESSISYCSHRAWGENDCSHSEDVAIRCAGQATYAPVRLVGGAVPYEGRVEVYHNGQWGTVCDDYADINFAKVVCREIGYPSSSPVIKNSGYFGDGNGQIWLDDVRCNGTEAALDECSHQSWGQNNCGHNEDVSVICRDHGIECYICDGISNPSNCRDTIFCSSFQSCHTSMYENNHQILYSQSCESKLVCDALNSVPSIIGRKRATGLRTTCCNTPLCNNVTIGVH